MKNRRYDDSDREKSQMFRRWNSRNRARWIHDMKKSGIPGTEIALRLNVDRSTVKRALREERPPDLTESETEKILNYTAPKRRFGYVKPLEREDFWKEGDYQEERAFRESKKIHLSQEACLRRSMEILAEWRG